MYNSIFFYALKSIKGSPLFTIFYSLFFACTISLLYIFLILFQYSGIFSVTVSIPIKVIFIMILSLFILFIISITTIGIKFVFIQYSRMFSSFLIFGAHRASLIKLIFVKATIFNLISVVLSVIIIGILYALFAEFINAIISIDNVFNAIKYFLLSSIMIIIINTITSLVISFLFLLEDPYDIMRATL